MKGGVDKAQCQMNGKCPHKTAYYYYYYVWIRNQENNRGSSVAIYSNGDWNFFLKNQCG